MVHTLPRNVLYHGREEPPGEQLELRAGPLSMVLEAGGLRFISLADREVMRGIYVAVRDRNWRTVPAVLANVERHVAADSFSITYDATNRSEEVAFSWKGSITGDSDGTIVFVMDGVARKTFLRNRIGFCVLHGTRECAGARCEIEHVDGTVQRAAFPYLISPDQPFLEMRRISHEVAPGVWTEVRFAGDIFEMEDQRNWTDASFKTYSTPLRLPSPVEVAEGATIAQSVTLRLHGATRAAPKKPSTSPVTLAIGAPSTAIPRIGLGISSHARPLTHEELRRLKALTLSHLRVDLFLQRSDYVRTLERAAGQAEGLGTALEVALFLSDRADDELRSLRPMLDRVRPSVVSWLIFHVHESSMTRHLYTLARELLAGYDPAASIGGGTNGYFAHLNRGRPPVDALDLICYAVNPQVHAFDNASLIESFEGCQWTVATAREFADGLPLAVTPITLRPRVMRPGTAPEAEPPGELPPDVDVRQMSLFGAGWTLGALKAFAENGVHSLTLYETTGWRGVMEAAEGPSSPHLFKSLPGAVFPLYHVLADVGEYSGGRVLPVISSEPTAVDGFAFERNASRRLLLANFRDRAREVIIEGAPQDVRVRFLDERTALAAMQSPDSFRREPDIPHGAANRPLRLQLLPYAVARVDSGNDSRGET